MGKLKSDSPTGQSRWLLLGGILVREENDLELPRWRDEMLGKFPARKTAMLHFRNLNHSQKVATCDYFAGKPFGICCVCSNKVTLVDNEIWFKRFKQKGYLYNYLTRYLLERITSSLRTIADQSGQKVELRVIFSRRPNTDYQSMREYLLLMRDGLERIKPVRSIDWSVFSPDDIKVENHRLWAGLQLADVATSATAAGLEPNTYGHYEPRYGLLLAKRYLATRKSILNSGLTLLPPIGSCPLDDAQRKFVMDLQEGWRAPGP